MAFVQLGGEAGARPTYFETYAADKLLPTLKAAVIYSLSVLAQSRPWLLRLLVYEEEVFAVVALLLERHSLATMHATFAESLYGLKRQPATPAAERPGHQQQQQQGSVEQGSSGRSSSAASAAALAAAGVRQPAAPPPRFLSPRQQTQALLCQVLLPYIKARLDASYAYHRARGGVLGLALQQQQQASRRRQQQQQEGQDQGQQHQQQQQQQERPLVAALQRLWVRALLASYPYVHAGLEGVSFVYQLGYLLDVFDCHSPVLQLLGQRLVRLSGQEMAEMERMKAAQQSAALQAADARGSRPGRALQRAWLRGASLFTDHLRSALILSVFGFKILEWWYTSAEDRLSSAAALPPPPAPPAPAPDAAGCGLPGDRALCPLCRQRRANPATLAVSGYVFCYPCLFRAVSEGGCCPVTRAPAGLDHIRRLYDEAM